MRQRQSQLRAFTLVELILVMAIIAILAAIVAPSLRGFTIGRRIQDNAQMIVGLANHARSAAMSEGRVYRLNFDTSAAAVWLTAQNGATFAAPGDEFGSRFPLADGVKMEVDATQQQDGQYVQFQPSGRTDTAHIQLSDSYGKVIQISCPSATELYHVVPAGEVQ